MPGAGGPGRGGGPARNARLIRRVKKYGEFAKFRQMFAKFTNLWKARSRLYRSQFLQVNPRWKALAEIYTMHSFAPFLESIIENWGKKNLAKTTPKKEKTRKREAIKQLAPFSNLKFFVKNRQNFFRD